MQSPNWNKILDTIKKCTIFSNYSKEYDILETSRSQILIAKLQQIYSDTNLILEKLDDLSYNISLLEERIGAVKDSIDGIESDIDDIKEAVTNKNYDGSIVISTEK